MGRTVRDRTETRPRPVERIELNGRHLGWRLLAVVLLLAFGAAALGYAITGFLSPSQPGWTEIEANGGINCAEDFVFLYEVASSAEQKALTALYTDLTAKAWALFNNVEAEDARNIRYLNDHPNEAVGIDPALYRAFETVSGTGSRLLYLAPIVDAYGNLFSCVDDALTVDFDPLLNDDLRAYFGEVAAFARDPEAVRIELLGDNQVRLRVSDEYAAFAAREEIDDFIDFHWTINAFIIDYLADGLTAQGFTRGALSSVDGFARALDAREGNSYAYNLYDAGQLAAVLHYSGPKSIVALRGYPLTNRDSLRYYVRQDGQIRTSYLDPADGLHRAAVSDLVACTDAMGCAAMLLRVAPMYIAETLNEDALAALSADGIQSVFIADHVLRATDAALDLSSLSEGYTTSIIAP